MFDIKEDEMLSKIHPYKLIRPDGWCNISVHEIIASEKAQVNFIAVPNLVLQDADKQYFGIGNSVDNALSDCLSKIKHLNISDLFPNLEESYQQIEKTPAPKD